jgi:maleate cis-trans isomerase
VPTFIGFRKGETQTFSSRLRACRTAGPRLPHALALQALGARRVAVATYYGDGDELNQAIVKYFARFDIEAYLMGGFRLSNEREALYTTSLMALDEVSFVQVYQYCRQAMRRIQLEQSVDAMYIKGGGWDVAPVVRALAAATLGISNPILDGGRLLREDVLPPRT